MIPITELLQMPDWMVQEYLDTLPDDQRQLVSQQLKQARLIKGMSPDDIQRPAPALTRMNALQDILARAPKIQPNLPEDETDEQREEQKRDINNALNRLSTLSGVVGTTMDIANMADPSQANVKTGAIAGGLQGISAGSALGPLGAVGGAFIGAIGGAVKAGSQREAYENEEEKRLRNAFTGLRVAPSMNETGGMSEDDTLQEIIAQNERGEILMLPDGRLVDPMAKKTHKEMKNEITDIMPTPTFVFSNSPKRAINLAKIKDHILTITRGDYSEDGNTPMEIIRMGDEFGKKGIVTPAQLAKKIRSKTRIVENPKEAVEILTNKQNIRRRAELLRPIMEMQEGLYKEFKLPKPEKFEMGGYSKRVRKNELGGLNECPPGHVKNQNGDCVPLDFNEIMTWDHAKQSDYIASLPEQEGISLAQKIDAQAKKIPITPLPQTQMQVVTGQRDLPIIRQPSTPNLVPTMTTVTPTTETTTPISSPYSTDLFPQAKTVIDEQSQQNELDYNSRIASATDLFRKNRLRNFANLSSRLLGVMGQNPNQTPVRQGTEFIDEMFPTITESEIRSNVSPMRQGQNRLLRNISESGISGSRLGSAIAATQSNLLESEGRFRGNALQFNKAQQGKRAASRREVITGNLSREIEAENATRSNRNQQIANIGEIGADYIEAQGGLDAAIASRMEELKTLRQKNKNTISQSKLDLLMKQEERNLRKVWFDKILRMKKSESLDKFLEPFIIG